MTRLADYEITVLGEVLRELKDTRQKVPSWLLGGSRSYELDGDRVSDHLHSAQAAIDSALDQVRAALRVGV